MEAFSSNAFAITAFSVDAYAFDGVTPPIEPPASQQPEYGSGGAMGWNTARLHIEAERERKRLDDEEIVVIVRFLAKWINDNHLL